VEEEAVWEGIITKESMWAFSEEGSIKMALEEVYKDYGRFVKRAKELQKWICKEFTEEKKYKEFISFLDEYFLDENTDEFAFFNKENND
jgi:hypothetical protein